MGQQEGWDLMPKLFSPFDETIPPSDAAAGRRKRLMVSGLSVGTIVSALVAFGPGACNTVVGFVEMRKDVEQLRKDNETHVKEHERLREWIRRISKRSQDYHGWIPEGTEDGREDSQKEGTKKP